MSDTRDPIDESDPAATDVTADATSDVTADITSDTGHRRAAVDLDIVEHDLDGVEAALRRLDDGTYWSDETTGRPIPDDVLAADPVARRAP